MKKCLLLYLFFSFTFLVSKAQNTFPSSGNAGIGTTSPQNSISVIGNGSFGITDNIYNGPYGYGGLTFPKGQIMFSNTNPQSQLYLISNGYTNSSGIFSYRNNGVSSGIGIDNGDVLILTGTSGTANSNINFNSALIVKNNGNVGIGTSSPQAKLHIQDGSVLIKTLRTGNNSEYALISGTQHVNGASGYAGVWLFEDGSGGFGQASGLSFKTSVNDVQPVTNMIIRGNGNVGIGTTNPVATLDVFNLGGIASKIFAHDASATQRSVGSYVYASGAGRNVFYGQATPQGLSNGETGFILTNYSNLEPGQSKFRITVATTTNQNPDPFNPGSYTDAFIVQNNGNVLIGQSGQANTAYKLDIAGAVRANQITVNTTGADFVFKNGYKLNSLSSVEKYIAINHHLPEIASAENMSKEGMDVGEMNKKLLQKVEELTLYLIEKDKQLQQEHKNVQSLNRRLTAIEHKNRL